MIRHLAHHFKHIFIAGRRMKKINPEEKKNIAITSLPLVFLPGFMLDETLWDEVTSQLQQGSAIHCLRLESGTTTQEIAQGVAKAAPERFVLIGFSLGGYIARKVTELFPERVAALVLVATSLAVDSDERIQARQHAIASMDASTFHGLSMRSIAKSLHPDRRGDKELLAKIKDMGRRLGYPALTVQSSLQRDQIAAAALSCPTLVIAASDDSLRTAEESKELAEIIPNAMLKTIEDSGHMLPLEQPKALADAIGHWLESLDGGPAG